MLRKLSLVLLVAWILASCSIPGIGLTRIEVGEVRTEEVHVPLPVGSSEPVKITLHLGAALLNLDSGSSDLIEGTILYNVDHMRPTVTVEDGDVRIEQGDLEAALPPSGTRNEWDLRLSKEVPTTLWVRAGAYQGTWNLGGLRLRELQITEGATRAEYFFDTPNPEPMRYMNINTGGSRVTLHQLANANFERMDFTAGIGTYVLDFSGDLRRSASARIRTGISTVTVIVPETTPARIRVRGALRRTTIDGNFVQDGDDYMTPGWDGASERLDIIIEMGLGNLTVRHPS